VLERAHGALSRGERHLADMARILHSLRTRRRGGGAAGGGGGAEVQPPFRLPLIVDEFAAGLDERAALALGSGITQYLARGEGAALEEEAALELLLVACRSDFLRRGALEPGWIAETGGAAVRVGAPRGRFAAAAVPSPPLAALSLTSFTVDAPKLVLELRPCAARRWESFKGHHYKSEALSPRARAFVVVLLRRGAAHGAARGAAEELVGFAAAIPHIGMQRGRGGAAGGAGAERGGSATWRAHRTVVLPHWQGLGIGGVISEAMGELHRRAGLDFVAQTVHPRLGAQRDGSPLWEALPWNHTLQRYRTQSWRQRKRNVVERLPQPRMLYAHRFCDAIDAGGAAYLERRCT
jgi:GNAT superfamily N-acetyltransferase